MIDHCFLVLPLGSLSFFFFMLLRKTLGEEVFLTPFTLNDRSDCGDKFTSFTETVELEEPDDMKKVYLLCMIEHFSESRFANY